MRRTFPLATLAALGAAVALACAPTAVEAQPRIMGGAGLSTPMGDFGDVAGVGWHLGAGLQVGIPTFPVSIRADGGYHSFGEETSFPKVTMLAGALSGVVSLPGVGLVPYFLGGVGMYRTTEEGIDSAVSDPGFHAAFGVNIGALGFGGFGEVRFVNIDAAAANVRFVTATVGFRL